MWMCFSTGHAAHWSTHPRLLHPRGGRSNWLRVLKTHQCPVWGNLSQVSQGSSCQSLTMLPPSSPSSCPPDRLTPWLCVTGPIQRWAMPLSCLNLGHVDRLQSAVRPDGASPSVPWIFDVTPTVEGGGGLLTSNHHHLKPVQLECDKVMYSDNNVGLEDIVDIYSLAKK